MAIDFNWLEQHLFGRRLSEEERAALKCLQEHEFKPWETIIEQGQPGGRLYVLRSGHVSIEDMNEGERVRITSIGEGAMFGEMSFLDDEKTTAQVVAIEPSVVYSLSRDDFWQWTTDHQQLVCTLFARMMRNQAKIIQQMNAELLPILRNLKARANRLPLFVKLFPVIFTLIYILAFCAIPSKY